MTLIGDKSRFAIGFYPIPTSNLIIPECSFTYWIDNKEIGNPEFEAPIDDIIEELREIYQYCGKRENLQLFRMESESLFHAISEGLSRDIDGGEFSWRQYNLTYYMGHGYPPGEGKSFEIYVVDSKEESRIIVGDEREKRFLFEKYVNKGEVDGIILSAWNAIGGE